MPLVPPASPIASRVAAPPWRAARGAAFALVLALGVALGVGGGGCTPEVAKGKSAAAAEARCTGKEGGCRPRIDAPFIFADGAIEEAQLEGKVVFVNFWASWCGPCVKEMPALERLYRKYKDRGFVVVGVLTSDRADDLTIQGFLDARGISYPVIRATPELERQFKLRQALPTSFLYDRAGWQRGAWEGEVYEAELDERLAPLLPADK